MTLLCHCNAIKPNEWVTLANQQQAAGSKQIGDDRSNGHLLCCVRYVETRFNWPNSKGNALAWMSCSIMGHWWQVRQSRLATATARSRGRQQQQQHRHRKICKPNWQTAAANLCKSVYLLPALTDSLTVGLTSCVSRVVCAGR